jgi:hypothetical protein
MQTATAEQIDLEISEAPQTGELMNLDPIGQLIKEADTRSEKSEQHAADARTWDAQADECSDKARKLQKASEDMLISAGLCYVEAQSKAQLAGRNWLEVVAEFSRYSRQHVARCIKIAKSSNPSRAAEEHRARKNANERENYKKKSDDGTRTENPGSISQPEDVEFDPLAGLTAISTEVAEPEPDPLVAIHKRRVMLTSEQFRADLRATIVEAKKLGYTSADIAAVVAEVFLTKRVPTPTDPRIDRAAALFFQVPAAKQTWLKQRMNDLPMQISVTGIHVDWINMFWACTLDEQQAIRAAVQIEESRRAA